MHIYTMFYACVSEVVKSIYTLYIQCYIQLQYICIGIYIQHVCIIHVGVYFAEVTHPPVTKQPYRQVSSCTLNYHTK